MRTKISVTFLSLMTLLVVTPAFAAGPLKTTIPFDFTVGGTRMSAGDYIVRLDVPGLMRITREDGKATCGVFTLGLQAKATPTQGKLVFNKYGTHYFLAQIWSPGDNQGRELLKDKAEKEIARSFNSRQQAPIYASVVSHQPSTR